MHNIGEHVMRVENGVLLDVTDNDLGNGKFVFPEDVTLIGINAFHCCKKLTTIVIPSAVNSIGECAFWGCDALTRMLIPESVTSIGPSAFMACDALSIIHIDATNGTDYSRILNLLPEIIQKRIEENHKLFTEKATILLAGGANVGFFSNGMLPEIKAHMLAHLAQQHGMPWFMGNEVFKQCALAAKALDAKAEESDPGLSS